MVGLTPAWFVTILLLESELSSLLCLDDGWNFQASSEHSSHPSLLSGIIELKSFHSAKKAGYRLHVFEFSRKTVCDLLTMFHHFQNCYKAAANSVFRENVVSQVYFV